MNQLFDYDIHFGPLTISLFLIGAILFTIAMVWLYRFVSRRHQIFERFHLYTLFLNLFALYAFAKMAEDVVNHEFITQVDVWVNHKMTTFWTPSLNRIMIFITNMISPLVLLLMSAILFVYLWWSKHFLRAILLGVSLATGLASFEIIKLIVKRARPSNALISVPEYSFPSGHSTMAVVFFSLLLFTLKGQIKSKLLRYLFIGLNIVVFLAIGFSRVYLDVHWMSDVVGGLSLGLFWTTFYVLLLKMYKEYYKAGDAKWLQRLKRKKR